MPCPNLSPKEYLCPRRMTFEGVRMGALDSQLHVIRVLTLQILLFFFIFPDMMSLQRHVFNWKPVL